MGAKGGFRSQVDAENEARARGESGFREFVGDPGVGGQVQGASTGPTSFGGSGGLSNLFQQQQAQQQDILGRFKSTIEGFESPSAISQRLGQDLQLPQLRQQQVGLEQNLIDLEDTLANLGGTIRQIPQQVAQQFTPAGVSQDQLGRLQAERALPFVEQRGRETERFGEQARLAQRGRVQLGDAESQLAQRLGLEVQQQQQQLLPFEQEFSLFANQSAREASGFSQAMQNELTQILSQQSQGFQASQASLDRAQQLAIQEQNFENELRLIGAREGSGGGLGFQLSTPGVQSATIPNISSLNQQFGIGSPPSSGSSAQLRSLPSGFSGPPAPANIFQSITQPIKGLFESASNFFGF